MYKNTGKNSAGLWWTYVLSLVFKMRVEATFVYLLYHIYEGYDFPSLIKCSQVPCPNVVDCYIGRPTEKKVFTYFMVGASALCIVLSVCEIIYLISMRIARCMNKFKRRERYHEPRYREDDSHCTLPVAELVHEPE
ncbi:hypothetical protein DKP78_15615, partial [Enterococcus faecium]